MLLLASSILRTEASIILLCGVFILFSCTNYKHNSGDIVAVKQSDGNFYLATVSTSGDSVFDVQYADGTHSEVTLSDIRYMILANSIFVGDTVFAIWSAYRFYPGVIIEKNTNVALVLWLDGTPSSYVSYEKIMRIKE